jgi:hypothetical protein
MGPWESSKEAREPVRGLWRLANVPRRTQNRCGDYRALGTIQGGRRTGVGPMESLERSKKDGEPVRGRRGLENGPRRPQNRCGAHGALRTFQGERRTGAGPMKDIARKQEPSVQLLVLAAPFVGSYPVVHRFQSRKGHLLSRTSCILMLSTPAYATMASLSPFSEEQSYLGVKLTTHLLQLVPRS